MDYKIKYFKYKNKYLELKNQTGGNKYNHEVQDFLKSLDIVYYLGGDVAINEYNKFLGFENKNNWLTYDIFVKELPEYLEFKQSRNLENFIEKKYKFSTSDSRSLIINFIMPKNNFEYYKVSSSKLMSPDIIRNYFNNVNIKTYDIILDNIINKLNEKKIVKYSSSDDKPIANFTSSVSSSGTIGLSAAPPAAKPAAPTAASSVSSSGTIGLPAAATASSVSSSGTFGLPTAASSVSSRGTIGLPAAASSVSSSGQFYIITTGILDWRNDIENPNSYVNQWINILRDKLIRKIREKKEGIIEIRHYDYSPEFNHEIEKEIETAKASNIILNKKYSGIIENTFFYDPLPNLVELRKFLNRTNHIIIDFANIFRHNYTDKYTLLFNDEDVSDLLNVIYFGYIGKSDNNNKSNEIRNLILNIIEEYFNFDKSGEIETIMRKKILKDKYSIRYYFDEFYETFKNKQQGIKNNEANRKYPPGSPNRNLAFEIIDKTKEKLESSELIRNILLFIYENFFIKETKFTKEEINNEIFERFKF